jgi:integrase
VYPPGGHRHQRQRTRIVPICDDLYNILAAIPPALHDNHVFLYEGKPVRDIRESLRRAFRLAGLSYGRKGGGVVFHDLRHTFNTNMRRAGVPESVIMKVTGHSTREMFDRYNTVDHEDTRRAVDQMQTFLKSVDQNVDQGTILNGKRD